MAITIIIPDNPPDINISIRAEIKLFAVDCPRLPGRGVKYALCPSDKYPDCLLPDGVRVIAPKGKTIEQTVAENEALLTCPDGRVYGLR